MQVQAPRLLHHHRVLLRRRQDGLAGHVPVGLVQVGTSSVRVESAWYQLFILKYDATAFKFRF